MHRFANPARFVRISSAVLPWAIGATVALLGVGFYMALFVAPADYQMGESVRIMFVHVPAAWMSMFVYSVMATASGVALIWRHPVADLTAKASAPIGAGFTAVALITGSLWGQPMWGTWWVWDARLTSVLILFFLYLGYMALWQAFDDPARGGRAAAILALVGIVNLPIIKFSVDWWNTLHQPASISSLSAPSMPPSMYVPLLILGLGYMTFYTAVLIVRVQREIIARKIRAMRLLHVDAGTVPEGASPQSL